MRNKHQANGSGDLDFIIAHKTDIENRALVTKYIANSLVLTLDVR